MVKAGLILLLFVLVRCSNSDHDIRVTHGPLLGRIDSESVAIWVRTSNPGTFRIKYGLAPGSMTYLSDEGITLLVNDNTGWVIIKGLNPATKYYYEPVADGKAFPGGTFRTLPDTTLYKDEKLNPEGLFNFSFEFACGNNQAKNDGLGTALPTFRTIIDKFADEISFSIQNGDWLYEEDREYTVAQWCEQTGTDSLEIPGIIRQAPSVTGVWQNYKGYLERGVNLAEFHRIVPCFYTIDDHEILNDVIACGETGYVSRRTVFRDIGEKAWYDYLAWSNPVSFTEPIRFGRASLETGSTLLVDSSARFTSMDREQQINLHIHWGTATAGVNKTSLDTVPGNPNAGVYDIVRVIDDNTLEITPPARADGPASYSIGRHSYFRKTVANCDLFFLDTRSSRDLHDHLDRANPEKSMIGEIQKKWLLEEIKKSTADFIFVVSSVNFMIPHLSGGEKIVDFKDDAWTAFLSEREELISSFDRKEAQVFILTGDLHNSFAIKITDNVWEFASGPRNSRNHNYMNEGGRPATGLYRSFDRDCNIRWSTWFLNDTPNQKLLHPHFCIVQVNNVLNSPTEPDGTRYIAYEKPQVIFRYYNGLTGDLEYAESITSR